MNGGDGGGVTAAPDGPPPSLYWKFSQVFGERTAREEVQEVDIISAIEFDRSGDHLATGDRGGRVVLFVRTDKKEQGGNRKHLEKTDYSISRHPEFCYKTEFQSHEPEVQEKKIKKVAEINMEPSKATGNGNVASSSVTSTSKPHLANGGYTGKSYTSLSSDLLLPQGGIPSLHLPVVVVPYPIRIILLTHK